jgi:hypothetical protein
VQRVQQEPQVAQVLRVVQDQQGIQAQLVLSEPLAQLVLQGQQVLQEILD